MSENRPVHHHYYACFWPPRRIGMLFCGGALIVIGAAWLLSNLGFLTEDWWEIGVPALFIVWGVVTLLGGREEAA